MTLTLHHSTDAEALAAAFVAATSAPGDPFVRPLVLVPGAGVQRWWSQRVATLSAADGQGISAGFDVAPLGAIERLLDPACARDDPWAPERLVWPILTLAGEAGDEALSPLCRHLAANDQRYANALRIARLLRRYVDYRPDLLASWTHDPQAAASELGFDGWQVRLWQRLHELIPAPDPVERRADLRAALAEGRHPVGWPSAHVFAPRRARPVDQGLVGALAATIDVQVWLLAEGPDDTAHPIGRALGREGRARLTSWSGLADAVVGHPGRPAAPTMLGRLQEAIRSGQAGPERTDDADRAPAARGADGSVLILASHGPSRQLEVLREALTGAFADDPTLQPREVAILCPDPAALAPHLAATFATAPDAAGSGWVHPATTLRVQVVDRHAADANRLYQLLRDVLQLGTGRADASELLALAAHPFVARRFGIGPDDLGRVEELVERAGIRWGIDARHRATFGLGAILQNTWQLGVQRLTMGEAFSADHLVAAGVVSTVDDVTSTDVPLVGSLAELVSRLSRAVRACAGPGTPGQWAQRLRELVEALADVPFADTWQLNQVWAALSDLEERSGASPALLGPPDALALLDAAFAERVTRPAYGNGSLVVASLDALAQVPHRVVCVVGLDERTFPRREIGDGDDLLARDPSPGAPDPGAEDRQAFLEALTSARDRFIVVYQGHSSLTHESYPPPAGVLELIEALGPHILTDATLQPFAPANFAADAPQSFDLEALKAARALLSPRRPAPDRYAVGHLHRPEPPDAIDLPTLTRLLQHPARFLLREAAGITLGDDDPLDLEIPLELDGLGVWSLGDRILSGLLAGHARDAVVREAWLSGEVPPHQLGAQGMGQAAAKAESIHRVFLREAPQAPQTRVVDLRVDGIRVTGQATTRGGRVVRSQYGRVKPRHLAAAWISALALTAQEGRRTDAVLIGPRGPARLVAPPPDLAQQFLADLVSLAQQGAERLLLMPPSVSHAWAQARSQGQDPAANVQLPGLWREDFDEAWCRYLPAHARPWTTPRRAGDPWGHPEETGELGALAALAWAPIVKACA